MKSDFRAHVGRFGLFLLIAVCAISVPSRPSAAGKPADVAGKYEGSVRGSSQGDMPLTVTLLQDGEKLTGGMDAGAGRFVFTIEGKVDGTKLSWNFSSSEVAGSVEGTFGDGAITGTWAASGEGGPFDLKRTGAR